MINFRLSNGYSHAIEFSATCETQFSRRLNSALSDYYHTQTGPAELNIRTNISGDWISANFPDSNAPYHVERFLSKTARSAAWDRVCACIRAGDQFDAGLKSLIEDIADE